MPVQSKWRTKWMWFGWSKDHWNNWAETQISRMLSASMDSKNPLMVYKLPSSSFSSNFNYLIQEQTEELWSVEVGRRNGELGNPNTGYKVKTKMQREKKKEEDEETPLRWWNRESQVSSGSQKKENPPPPVCQSWVRPPLLSSKKKSPLVSLPTPKSQFFLSMLLSPLNSRLFPLTLPIQVHSFFAFSKKNERNPLFFPNACMRRYKKNNKQKKCHRHKENTTWKNHAKPSILLTLHSSQTTLVHENAKATKNSTLHGTSKKERRQSSSLNEARRQTSMLIHQQNGIISCMHLWKGMK